MGSVSSQNAAIKLCCSVLFFFFFLQSQIVLTPVIAGGDLQTCHSQWRGLRTQKKLSRFVLCQPTHGPSCPVIPKMCQGSKHALCCTSEGALRDAAFPALSLGDSQENSSEKAAMPHGASRSGGGPWGIRGFMVQKKSDGLVHSYLP